MFPPDFFNGMKDNSGFRTDRNSNSTNFSLDNFIKKEETNPAKKGLKIKVNKETINCNCRVISDYQKEVDEDKELLDLFNGVNLKGINFIRN